jgi:hypothetical protein
VRHFPSPTHPIYSTIDIYFLCDIPPLCDKKYIVKVIARRLNGGGPWVGVLVGVADVIEG